MLYFSPLAYLLLWQSALARLDSLRKNSSNTLLVGVAARHTPALQMVYGHLRAYEISKLQIISFASKQSIQIQSPIP